MITKICFSAFCLIIGTCIGAIAAEPEKRGSFIKDCDSALIRATYNKIEYQRTDWRLAEKVDSATYDQIKNSAGVEAVIYGVPVGASYDSFKETIKTLKKEHTESYTTEQFRNVAWAGLDSNSVTAYQECLRTAASLARKVIVLLPDKASALATLLSSFNTHPPEHLRLTPFLYNGQLEKGTFPAYREEFPPASQLFWLSGH